MSSLQGQNAVIEIIDNNDATDSEDSLAHLLVDEIRQAERAAVQPTASSVVMTTTGHTQALVLDMGDPNPVYIDGKYYIYYLENFGFHSWALAKTDDLLTSSFPQTVLSASGDAAKADQWIGSGSVLKAQDGSYHMFYTGHNKNLSPVETVMHATAKDASLTAWQPIPADTFTGSDGYSDYDFRDPLVFWNQTENQYWMLITTRYQGKAAIGLYTSDDLQSWNAEPPLYTEVSDLNLEVADYFELNGTPFIVYSDQRDNSRQVKYLMLDNNSWVSANLPALDGRAYYAARTAGSADERLMFGWVADNFGRKNDATPDWGGDLVVHQMHLKGNELAVKLPEKYHQGMSKSVPLELTSQVNGSAVLVDKTLTLQAQSSAMLAASNLKNRLSFKASSNVANTQFGLKFLTDGQAEEATIDINTDTNQVVFYWGDNKNNTTNPEISVPMDLTDGIEFELMLDPEGETGSLYINQHRALSFRLYDLETHQVGFYSENDAITITELERYTR